MIFAEINYEEHYDDFHNPLLEYIKDNFDEVESGHQGDSWIWIYEGESKVAIDTFSAMKHQIKSDRYGIPLVQKVIEALQKEYNLSVLPEPDLEAHEE